MNLSHAPPSLGPQAAALWTFVFANANPVSIEIGSGRGEFLIAIAPQHPAENFFGIERAARRVRGIEARLVTAGLANARIVRADATCLIGALPDACVAAYHILFPDPWWKRRHQRRRLITPAFVAELRRTLVPGGRIHLVTDVGDIFALAQRHLDGDPELEGVDGDVALHASTSFARKARSRGDQIHTSTHRRHPLSSLGSPSLPGQTYPERQG